MSNKDFKVKNGIQPTVYHEAVGTVVSGSVPYSIGSASYDSVSFNFNSQAGGAYALEFNSAGTKLYLLDEYTGNVYQYSLSTAFDLSTASYDSVSFSVSSQDSFPTGLTFNSTGTKLYIVGLNTNSVYQYSLSTAYDLSTTSYDSVSLSASGQDSSCRDIGFNSNGTKLYVLGDSSNSLHQYSLSTAYDLTSATYDSVSLDVSSQSGDPYGFTFKPDGTSLYVATGGGGVIFQYNLSTAFDLSTASYSSLSFDTSSQSANPSSLSFNNDGSKLYFVGASGTIAYQYSTVLTTASLDLSTGSVFDYTPTSDVQVTLTNPAASGTSSGATLLLGSEDSTGVSSTFSTTLYDGTGAAQTITNGIDLAGDGGLVWIKPRNSVKPHVLQHKTSHYLASNTTDAEIADTRLVTQFNSDGFNVGIYGGVNGSSDSLVSWTFKKQTKFFDIVTWTGNGVTTGRNISHNLGSTVGTIILKKTSGISAWAVWHRTLNSDEIIILNESSAKEVSTGYFNGTAPTSTQFTVGEFMNDSGGEYVAYLFAHDTDASSIIKCGSYTGTGSAGNAVTLGWEPQWLIIKRTDAAQQWPIVDTVRGMSATGQVKQLRAQSQSSESTVNDKTSPSATGFTLNDGDAEWNGSGGNYIYIAIRASNIPTITYDPDLQWSGGTAPTLPATGETDVITFNTTDGGTTYKSALAIDGAK